MIETFPFLLPKDDNNGRNVIGLKNIKGGPVGPFIGIIQDTLQLYILK